MEKKRIKKQRLLKRLKRLEITASILKFEIRGSQEEKESEKGTELFKKLLIFDWRIIALQYCVGFCHTST